MLTYCPAMNVLKGRDDVDIQKAGFLSKHTNNTIRKWKEYYFRLGRMSILCYRKDTDVRDGKEPKFKIELSDIDDITQPMKKNNKASKQFFLIFNQGVLSLKSEELADANDWITKLKEAVKMCQKRRELHSELLRASFKMAVEKNVRNKYVHSNPQKVVDEMPKKTFLKRIDLKQVSPPANKVSYMPPLRPDKRCISIGGNMISKRDNMACFQQQASPRWKNNNYKTIYKNLNKDSLRKTLLKKNASKERSSASSANSSEEDQEGSMIITTNLGFESADALINGQKERQYPVYSSLDGLNRMGGFGFDEPRGVPRRRHSVRSGDVVDAQQPQQQNWNRNRHRSGDSTNSEPVRTFDEGMPRNLHPQHHQQQLQQQHLTPRPVLDRSMSYQQPKYSPATLFGWQHQQDGDKVSSKTFMDPRITSSHVDGPNMEPHPQSGRITPPSGFQRQSTHYSSFNPVRQLPSNFQRDLLTYRSVSNFQQGGRGHLSAKHPPYQQYKNQRHQLNTISENDGNGSSRSTLAGSRTSMMSDNKGIWENNQRNSDSKDQKGKQGISYNVGVDNYKGSYESKALWSKEFYEQITQPKSGSFTNQQQNKVIHESGLNVHSFYIHQPRSSPPRIPRPNKIARSLSETQQTALNNHGYVIRPAYDMPAPQNVVTRSNTFTTTAPQLAPVVYSSGCVPLVRRALDAAGAGHGVGVRLDAGSGCAPASVEGGGPTLPALWRTASCIP